MIEILIPYDFISDLLKIILGGLVFFLTGFMVYLTITMDTWQERLGCALLSVAILALTWFALLMIWDIVKLV